MTLYPLPASLRQSSPSKPIIPVCSCETTVPEGLGKAERPARVLCRATGQAHPLTLAPKLESLHTACRGACRDPGTCGVAHPSTVRTTRAFDADAKITP